MKKYSVFIGFLMVVVSFGFSLLGLMNLVPIYYTAPPLFLSLLFTLSLISTRKRFKGFRP